MYEADPWVSRCSLAFRISGPLLVHAASQASVPRPQMVVPLPMYRSSRIIGLASDACRVDDVASSSFTSLSRLMRPCMCAVCLRSTLNTGQSGDSLPCLSVDFPFALIFSLRHKSASFTPWRCPVCVFVCSMVCSSVLLLLAAVSGHSCAVPRGPRMFPLPVKSIAAAAYWCAGP